MGLNIPSFFGYYNASTGLLANQMALDTINQNISNVNTPGYSEQRVDQTAGDPYPPASLWNSSKGGQLGQGVQVTGVTRAHSNFLDDQIRQQSSSLNAQQTIQDNLQYAEGIMAEPKSNGAGAAMTDFFTAAQALSTTPDSPATRQQFIQSGQNMLNVFQEEAQQLQNLRNNLVGDPNNSGTLASSQAALTVNDINTQLSEVTDLNSQIESVEAGGAKPNDLLDKRDYLLGQLANKLNISVDYSTTSDQVNVRIGNNYLIKGTKQTDSLNIVTNTGASPTPDDTPALVQLASTSTTINSDITGGKLGGILTVGGNAAGTTTIRSVLGGLDTTFNQLATQINSLQSTGRDLNGNIPSAANSNIFNLAAGTTLSIFRYSINSNLVSDPSLIAAANDDAGAFDGPGDGRNAQAMAALETTNLAGLGNTTLSSYYNSQLSQLGTASKSAQDSTTNLTNVVQQLTQRQQSIQGVNMDEEMVNLLKYQRGFEASAKVMNTLNQTIDTIINKMF